MKNNAWKSIVSLMLCAVMLFGCVSALAQSAQQPVAQVTQVMTGQTGARMRSQPTAYGDNVIFNLGPYVELDVISFEDEWYRVKYNGRRGYVHSGVVFVTGISDDPRVHTGADVPDSYYADQELWASLLDLHGDTFLFDGNNNAAFAARDVRDMDGEYWRYGGHPLETTGLVTNKGANLRLTMDPYSSTNIVYQNLPRRTRLDVKCYFFDNRNSVWYYVEVAGMEGYVHSDNVEVDGFEPPVAEEEEDDLFF